MNTKEVVLERRRWKRFSVKEGALAFDNFDFGQIVDVSEGGLAFMTKGWTIRPMDFVEINVLCDDGFHINKIQSKTVSNLSLKGETVFDREKGRRVSVHFGPLTNEQTNHLKQFIEKYAT